MATATTQTTTRLVMKEVEEQETQVVLTLTPDEALFIKMLLGSTNKKNWEYAGLPYTGGELYSALQKVVANHPKNAVGMFDVTNTRISF